MGASHLQLWKLVAESARPFASSTRPQWQIPKNRIKWVCLLVGLRDIQREKGSHSFFGKFQQKRQVGKPLVFLQDPRGPTPCRIGPSDPRLPPPAKTGASHGRTWGAPTARTAQTWLCSCTELLGLRTRFGGFGRLRAAISPGSLGE